MMAFEKLEAFLGLKTVAVLFGFLGALGMHLWSRFQARRIALSWTANFQKLIPEGPEPIFSKIQLLLDSTKCQNLYSCHITIRNESTQDVDAFDLLFTFENSFLVLYGQGSISTSAKNLLPSKNFLHTAEVLQKVPEDKRKEHVSYTFVTQHREFEFPALNRGTSANFTFLINAENPGQKPVVRATTEKKGLRLVSRPPMPLLWDVPITQAAVWGIISTLVLVFIVSRLQWSSAAIAFTSFGLGSLAAIIGVFTCRLFRFFKGLFG